MRVPPGVVGRDAAAALCDSWSDCVLIVVDPSGDAGSERDAGIVTSRCSGESTCMLCGRGAETGPDVPSCE